MAHVPDDLRYTRDHEYVRPTEDPNLFLVGITDFAQSELGDVVVVFLPNIGDRFATHAKFGEIEAVKTVATLFMPVAGEVVEVNGALDGDPAAVNREPYGAGWMIKVRADRAAEVNELLSAEAYRAHIGE